eukprot:TRINITY_DN6167_c1_g1_i1.p1 TRINITY_DN6167_c1_g1~~TRINITY_DN6167_c1_g1_i1.p1  ORF type:complete len:277 (-),score=17.86 TRINITY_DN6167_c1_g1_i1:61-807(-)
MALFKLWLHAVHGTAVNDVSPLCVPEVGLCASAADRVLRLAETVSSMAMLSPQTLNGCLEVSLTAGGLYIRDENGGKCTWLPLASSTIAHCESVRTSSLDGTGNVAGLLAYSAPIAPKAFSWGSTTNSIEGVQPTAAEHVWVFVVVSMLDTDGVDIMDAQASILQSAMEQLGAYGAIRGDLVGLRSLSVALGEGHFSSVHLVQRELMTQSRILRDDARKRSPLAGTMRTARNAALGSNISALAAKVMT